MPNDTQLSDYAVQEFKAIYAEEFGEILSDPDAHELALNLLRVFDLVTRSPEDSVARPSERRSAPG